MYWCIFFLPNWANETFSNNNPDHLPDVGDSGVAADARGVDSEPAGGGGGGDHQVSVVDWAVQVGDTHLTLS